MRQAWTNVNALIAKLERRWSNGEYLQNYASGLPWNPIELSIKAPTATELLDHFEEAVRWVEKFQRDSRTQGDAERFHVMYRTVKGRNLGVNSIPARIRVDSFEQLSTLLGTTADIRILDAIMEQTRAAIPELLAWVIEHPLTAIKHQERWSKVLATVAWIAANDTPHLYLRQIDVEGVDTKFVEGHKKVLDELLTVLLPPQRIDPQFTYVDFTRRFQLRSKPSYTRLRLLCPQSGFPLGISELTLRTDEFAALEPKISTVFVVENETTYLAFPAVPDSIVVFGSGFGLAGLRDLHWLGRKQIVYWGDIDTHGFDILNHLRSHFGSVQSILMDHATLLGHSQQWVAEPTPTRRPLSRLTESETALYSDLIEDRFGRGIRLEQERVRFSFLRQALASLRIH